MRRVASSMSLLVIFSILSYPFCAGFEGGKMDGGKSQNVSKATEDFLNASISYKKDGKVKLVNTALKENKNSYYMDEASYKAEFKKKITDNESIKYSYSDYGLSFTPRGLGWNNAGHGLRAKEVKGELIKDGKEIDGRNDGNWAGKGIIYKDAFGKGLDIGVITKNLFFEKIFKVNSLEDLGNIPEDSKYLEVEFELGSAENLEFNIYGRKEKWNKKDEWIVKDKVIEFGPRDSKNKSYIRPAHVWDSGKERAEAPIELCFSNKNGKLYLTKRIPVEFLKKAIFPVYSDATISFGSAYVFKAGSGNFAAAKIDSTHFVVIYSYQVGGVPPTTDYYGAAVIGTVSGAGGNEISYGSESVFKHFSMEGMGDIREMGVSCLDSTHFVVCYNYNSGSGMNSEAVIGTVSETNISFGSSAAIQNARAAYMSVSALDSTHFVAVFADEGNSYYGTAVIGTVSGGNNIAFGSEYIFKFEESNYTSCGALDSTHFVVALADWDSSKGVAYLGTVSGAGGNEISYGSESIYNTDGKSIYNSIAKIDSTHFVICYQDFGGVGGSHGKAVVGTVSGSNLSFGSECEFSSTITDNCSASSFDSSNFVVCFTDGGDSYHPKACVGSISGTAITFSGKYQIVGESGSSPSAATLDSSHFVAAYGDSDSDGTGIIGTVTYNTAPVLGWSSDNVLGTCSEATDGSGSVTVNYKIKDAESNPCTTLGWQYSTNGTDWTNIDSSYLTGASGSKNSAPTFDAATAYQIVWASKNNIDNTRSTTVQFRFKVNDGTDNSAYGTSANFEVDNKKPVISSATSFSSAPMAGNTTITLTSTWTEDNPNTSNFWYALNSTTYSGPHAGSTNVTNPSATINLGVTLDGDDYFTKIKSTLTDDYGNTSDASEVISDVGVKPYTPANPTLSNPTSTTLDVTVNKHASESDGLSYAIYITPAVGGNNYVQADGSVGAAAVWQTIDQWGIKTITGLASGTSYTVKTKSRNTNVTTVESDFNSGSTQSLPSKLVIITGAQILNTNAVSEVITVQVQDDLGNSVTLGSNQTVNLTTTSSVGRFDTSSTGNFDSSITSITILAGSSSANFYYKDSRGGTPTITCTPSGQSWTAATQTETINAPANSGNLSGTVVKASTKYARVKVEIYNSTDYRQISKQQTENINNQQPAVSNETKATPVATIYTDNNGNFSSDLSAGDYVLKFTGITGYNAFQVSVTLTQGTTTTINPQFIDPAGVVYNSATKTSLQGATVTITETNTGVVGYTVVTGANGRYQWLAALARSYTITVTPPANYVFPSTTIQALTPPDPLPGPAQNDLNGLATGRYYLNFRFIAGSGDLINNDLPLDIGNLQNLRLRKTINKKHAFIGDVIVYTITIENPNNFTVSNFYIEDLPAPQIKYLDGSSFYNGGTITPTNKSPLVFNGLSIAGNSQATLSYKSVIGSHVQLEKAYTNRAIAKNVYGSEISNLATAQIKIVHDPLFDEATVIGVVFEDKNRNGEFDADEKGIPHAQLYEVTGICITADENGKWHLSALKPNKIYLFKIFPYLCSFWRS